MKLLIIFNIFLLYYQLESSTLTLLKHPLDVMCKLDNGIMNYKIATVHDTFLYLVLYHSLLEDIREMLEYKPHEVFEVYTYLRISRRPLFIQVKLNTSLCKNVLKWTQQDISNVGCWWRLNRKKWVEINDFIDKKHRNITCEINKVLYNNSINVVEKNKKKVADSKTIMASVGD